MIDFYYWPTPNGWKVAILLEELGHPYNMIPVRIGKGDRICGQPIFGATLSDSQAERQSWSPPVDESSGQISAALTSRAEGWMGSVSKLVVKPRLGRPAAVHY